MKWVRWWTDSSAAKNNVLVAAWSKKGALGQKSRVVFEVPPVLSWIKGQSQREHTLGAGKRRGQPHKCRDTTQILCQSSAGAGR